MRRFLSLKDTEMALQISKEDELDHLNFNNLNTMTMSHFAQNFVQEINERVTRSELLTVRDLQKIRVMLKYIYRQVLRLTSPPEETQ